MTPARKGLESVQVSRWFFECGSRYFQSYLTQELFFGIATENLANQKSKLRQIRICERGFYVPFPDQYNQQSESRQDWNVCLISGCAGSIGIMTFGTILSICNLQVGVKGLNWFW